MFKFPNWLRAGVIFASLVFLGPACSSEKDDDEDEVELTWKCWADTSNGSCECIGSGPLEDSDRGGTNIEEVDDCSGRDVCFSYFDEFAENEACACGDSTFMPGGDVSDLDTAESCPPE